MQMYQIMYLIFFCFDLLIFVADTVATITLNYNFYINRFFFLIPFLPPFSYQAILHNNKENYIKRLSM